MRRVFALAALACSCAPDAGERPFAWSAAIRPTSPQVRWIDVTCSIPCAATATWEGGAREIASADPAGSHALRLLGLAPGIRDVVDLELTGPAGEVLARTTLSLTTEPLPAFFPDITVSRPTDGPTEPGLTLIQPTALSRDEVVLMLDDAGVVRWRAHVGRSVLLGMVWQPEEERILASRLDGKVVAVDLDGNVTPIWSPEPLLAPGDVPVDATRFSHDVAVDPDGSLVTFDEVPELRATFPGDYGDASVVLTDEPVLDLRVVTFDASGAVTRAVDLGDVLDPDRLAYDALAIEEGARDWLHGNAIQAQDDGSLLLSLRHQDALVQLGPDGGIAWIAAPLANWSPPWDALLLQPASDFRWFYHQHGPHLLDDGTLLVFDNGSVRSSPGEESPPLPLHSRVVQYRVDPAAMTIREEWAWEPADAPVFSPIMGGARRLPATGNTLATFGYVERIADARLAEAGLGDKAVRVVELSPARDVVWQLDLSAPAEESPRGWHAFMAYRIPPPW